MLSNGDFDQCNCNSNTSIVVRCLLNRFVEHSLCLHKILTQT
jgi:hypothetical protein